MDAGEHEASDVGDPSHPRFVTEWRDGVLTVIDYGTHSREEAERYRDQVFEHLVGRDAGSVPAVVDLRQADGVAPQAREVFKELIAHDAFGRVAFVVESTFLRVAATFVVRASGRGGATRFFGDMDAALAWLRS